MKCQDPLSDHIWKSYPSLSQADGKAVHVADEEADLKRQLENTRALHQSLPIACAGSPADQRDDVSSVRKNNAP